jgi:hypothetical protein
MPRPDAQRIQAATQCSLRRHALCSRARATRTSCNAHHGIGISLISNGTSRCLPPQAAGSRPAYTRIKRGRAVTGLKRRAPYYYVVHAWSRPFLELVTAVEKHLDGCVCVWHAHAHACGRHAYTRACAEG